MTPFQLTCEQALKPSWAKKRVGEQSEPRGAWGRGNGGRSCFDVSSLGCLDAPAVLPTLRLGARAELLLKLTNQKPARKLETEPSIDATLFFFYSSSITEHHFLNSRGMI